MKKLLLGLCLLLGVMGAQAKHFEGTNRAGGSIILTNRYSEQCSGKWHVMYATRYTGETIFGCWTYFDGRVQVVYGDGAFRSYPVKLFEVVED